MMDIPAREEDKVELIVRAAGGLDEVTLMVLPQHTLGQIKEQLAKELDRPEIIARGSKAQFVKFLPNGEAVTAGPDGQKLGQRRVLMMENAKIFPTPPELPPFSLDDFEEYDPEAGIGSPRSLRACAAEGLLPEELIYAPPEAFFPNKDFPPRLARIRHDFFECYRQDILRAVRATRHLLIREDAGDVTTFSGSLESARGDHGNFSSSSSRMFSSTAPCSNSAFMSPQSGGSFGFASGSSWDVDDTIAGAGGTWTGPLSSCTNPESHPATHLFFSKHRGATDRGACRGTGAGGARLHLYEGPLRIPRPGGGAAPTRFGSGKLRQPGDGTAVCLESIDDLSLVRSLRDGGTYAPDAADDLCRKLNKLRGMKAQKIPGRSERMGGLVERTELQTIRQRRKDSIKLDIDQDELRYTIEGMIAVAEQQKIKVDKVNTQEADERRHIDISHKSNETPYSKKVQSVNAGKAEKRLDIWNQRREAIFQNALDAEARRNEELEERTNREQARTKRVQQLRDLRKVGFARKWVDRSVRWSAAYGDVSAGDAAFRNEIRRKHKETKERIDDQHFRMEKYVETIRELRNLRKTFQDMTADRERRRQEQRRLACAAEFERMATERMLEDSLPPEEGFSDISPGSHSHGFNVGSMASPTSTLGSSSPLLSRKAASSTMPLISPTHALSLRRRHGIAGRVDFPRLASDILSPQGGGKGTMLPALTPSASAPSLYGGWGDDL